MREKEGEEKGREGLLIKGPFIGHSRLRFSAAPKSEEIQLTRRVDTARGNEHKRS